MFGFDDPADLISHKLVKVPSVEPLLWNDTNPGTLEDTGKYGATLDGMLKSGKLIASLTADVTLILACNMTKFPTVYIDDAVIVTAEPPGPTTVLCCDLDSNGVTLLDTPDTLEFVVPKASFNELICNLINPSERR